MKEFATDMAFLIGAVLVAYGLYLIYAPVAFIFCGVALMTMTVLLTGGHMNGNRKRIK